MIWVKVDFKKKIELGKGRKALQNYQPRKWKMMNIYIPCGYKWAHVM